MRVRRPCNHLRLKVHCHSRMHRLSLSSPSGHPGSTAQYCSLVMDPPWGHANSASTEKTKCHTRHTDKRDRGRKRNIAEPIVSALQTEPTFAVHASLFVR